MIDGSCCYTTSSIVVTLLFPNFALAVWIRTLLVLLAVHSRTTVGELAARAKTNSLKEQLQKPLKKF
jgi:hypothetical protein